MSLGKTGSIIHIKEMADKTDNTSGPAPLYRERRPEGEAPRKPVLAKKPAENAAKPESGNTDEKKTGEFGGPKGPEPTRFGDWERDGRCVDF